jgi:hypothetical protein
MNFNECFLSDFSSLTLYSLSPDVCYFAKPDGATIKSISENIVVNPGDEAKLSCAVDGELDGKTLHLVAFLQQQLPRSSLKLCCFIVF